MTFTEWLLAQAGRDEWIGALARAAAGDTELAADGDADMVRLRLTELEADPDMFEQLDDAEREWAGRESAARGAGGR